MCKKYDEKIKKDVVDDYNKGMLIKEISEKYGVPRSTVGEWIYLNAEKVDIHNNRYTESEFGMLKKQNKRQEMIIQTFETLLSTSLISEDAKLIACKEMYKQGNNMALVCKTLKIDKAKFYRYIDENKKPTWFKKKEDEITPLIKQIFEESKQRFGPQKIRIKLIELGYRVSEKRIREIMNNNDLKINMCVSKLIYPKPNKNKYRKNKLRRQFNQTTPNKVWVSDVTYIKVNDINCYLCVIMDLFSRKIIASIVSTTNSDSLTTRTFRKAYFDRNNPENLLFHSDQGANYTSKKMTKLLKTCNVQQSFSNPGTPYDNAVIESFFATLKKELISRNYYETIVQLKNDIAEYVDYYNNYRPHRKLGNKTPAEFEADYYSNLDKVN